MIIGISYEHGVTRRDQLDRSKGWIKIILSIKECVLIECMFDKNTYKYVYAYS